jgi:hypothetical protein
MSHRRRRKLRKTAARVVLVLSIVVFTAAAADFAITTYQKTNCLNGDSGDPSGLGKAQSVIKSDDCFAAIMEGDRHLRRDGAVAMLALAMAIAVGVIRSKAHRRTRDWYYRPQS